MWLSLMKPITLRPVSCSISLLTSACMTRCQRRRRSSTAWPLPALASVCAACEAVLEHDEDAVFAERGLRLGRAAAGCAGERSDQCVGDRCGELASGSGRSALIVALHALASGALFRRGSDAV